ncbi:hypothetical protein FRC19_005794 [Serendipita sp. 401]|nr:hypothetical protein FRC19_005794 [Serendipita sp. 401]
MELHLAGDFKKTEKKITWLASSTDAPKPIHARLVDFDYLLTKKKIEEGEDWLSFVTPVTEFRKAAVVDANCAALEPGVVVQFERKGYYILDSTTTTTKTTSSSSAVDEMVFFLIPDGKVATVASKADKSVASSGPTNPNTTMSTSMSKETRGSDKAGRPAETAGAAGAAGGTAARGYTTGPGVTPMYSVKAMTTDEPIAATGLKMYTVKPVY